MKIMEIYKTHLKIIGKILSFTLLVFIVLFLTNFIYEYRVLAVSENNFINKNSKNKLTAFFGSSHTEYSVNTSFIPNSYNFGTSGLNYVNTYNQIRWLTDNNFTIQTAIFEIDMVMFTDTLFNSSKTLDSQFENILQSINQTKENCIFNNKLLSEKITNCFPVIGHGSNFFLINQDVQNISSDFSKLNKSERRNIAEKYRDFRRATIAENLIPRGDSLDTLIKSLEMLNESNIIFIIYPVSREYDEDIHSLNITKEMYYNHLIPQIKASGVEYSLLDYYSVFFENPEYFMNAGHLNNEGKQIFTEMLYKNLSKGYL